MVYASAKCLKSILFDSWTLSQRPKSRFVWIFSMLLTFIQELMRKGVVEPANLGNLYQTLKSGYLGIDEDGDAESSCQALLDLVNRAVRTVHPWTVDCWTFHNKNNPGEFLNRLG